MAGLFRGKGDFWRYSLRLTIPVSLQNLLVSSFSLVDTIMIGALGDVALASVGMACQWAWLLSLILFGFSSGMGVFIAQYWGIHDVNNIRKSFGLGSAIAITFTLIFTATALIAPRWILSLFSGETEVISLGSSYLGCAAFSYIAITLNVMMGTILRSTEQVKLPLYVSIVSVIMNAALNALFIYVLDMGVRGAAIATAISSWISPVLLLAVSIRQQNILYAPLKAFVGWSGAFVRKFFRVSLPTLANEGLWALGVLAYRAIYSNTSTDFYAAYTIFSSIDGIMYSFFVGMCHACSVMVGKRVGAGALDDAYEDAKSYMLIFPLLTVCTSLLFLVLKPFLLMPFSESDPATLVTAGTLILIYLCEMPLRNVNYLSIVGIFRAGGDTKFGLIFDTGCLWGLAVPIVWLGARVLHMDLTMVFLCMLVVEDIVKAAMCIKRFVSRKWIIPVTDQGANAP